MMALLQSLGKTPWAAEDNPKLLHKNPRGFYDSTKRLKAEEFPDFSDSNIACKLFLHDFEFLNDPKVISGSSFIVCIRHPLHAIPSHKNLNTTKEELLDVGSPSLTKLIKAYAKSYQYLFNNGLLSGAALIDYSWFSECPNRVAEALSKILNENVTTDQVSAEFCSELDHSSKQNIHSEIKRKILDHESYQEALEIYESLKQTPNDPK